MPEGWLTTAEVAAMLDITIRRVQALINSGRLPAEKVGQIWLVKAADVNLVRKRKPGRPSKRKD
jgi:excisionase family DNA binding protein